jgi:hypothetical protein
MGVSAPYSGGLIVKLQKKMRGRKHKAGKQQL